MTEAKLREGVEKKLGRSAFVDRERADILIEGEDISEGGRFRARVTQQNRSGVILGARELDAQSCAGLLRTATIVVALFIEPGGSPPPDQNAPANPGSNEHPTNERVDAPPRAPVLPRAELRASAPATLTPNRRRSYELSLGIGAAAMVGLLPSASGAIRVAARLERPRSRWSFAWSAGYSIPQTLRDGGVRGTFSAIDQQVRACWAFASVSALRLDGCGGLHWGALIPNTTGVSGRNDAWRPMIGPVGTVELQVQELSRAARLELGFVAPPVRRALYYVSSEGNEERFYTTATVIIFVGLSGLLTI